MSHSKETICAVFNTGRDGKGDMGGVDKFIERVRQAGVENSQELARGLNYTKGERERGGIKGNCDMAMGR